MFTPKIGEDSQFDEYFSKGLVGSTTNQYSFLFPPKKISCFMDPSSEFIFGSSSPAPATVLDVPDGRWDGIGSRLMNEAKCTKIMLHLQHHLGGGFKHYLFPSLPEEDSHLA